MECRVCHGNVDEAARFCPQCGAQVRQENAPSDYEIGKIAALASIKKDVIAWLGAPVLAITVVTGVLGWLGLSEMVKSSVITEVKTAVTEIKNDINRELDRQRTAMDHELERERTSVDKMAQDILTAFGKIKGDQEQVNKLLTEQKN